MKHAAASTREVERKDAARMCRPCRPWSGLGATGSGPCFSMFDDHCQPHLCLKNPPSRVVLVQVRAPAENSPVGGFVRADRSVGGGDDGLGGFHAHRGPDRGEVVGAGHSTEFVHCGEGGLRGHDPCRGRHP